MPTGIYIPAEEHRKIHHSVLRNYGMGEINALAFNYLQGGLEKWLKFFTKTLLG